MDLWVDRVADPVDRAVAEGHVEATGVGAAKCPVMRLAGGILCGESGTGFVSRFMS